jgi:hypothetical protein
MRFKGSNLVLLLFTWSKHRLRNGTYRTEQSVVISVGCLFISDNALEIDCPKLFGGCNDFRKSVNKIFLSKPECGFRFGGNSVSRYTVVFECEIFCDW